MDGTFLGKWWFVQGTAKVFHRKEGCSHFVVSRKDGDTYNVVAQYTVGENSQKTRRINLDFEDESEHPAKFAVYLDGTQVVWATVLGTDYDHWAVIYIREGGFETFTVASRRPRLDAAFDSAARMALQESQVTTDLSDMSGKSCPDDI
ncbi:uncharacterized protein LOC120844019 [Ixodes scapularis]|uniref:uncharacterized protein LOC120844019 n=1 Tax=Ixodes scapularis TaxID=6945 RepID=UPI001A9CD7CC|nr:uncharacterized protein LOC120844019 [Ixodes scapularis]